MPSPSSVSKQQTARQQQASRSGRKFSFFSEFIKWHWRQIIGVKAATVLSSTVWLWMKKGGGKATGHS